MNQQIDARFAGSILISGFTSKNGLFPVGALARRLYLLSAAGKDDPTNGWQFESDFLDILPHFTHSLLAEHAGHKLNRKLARENIMDSSFGCGHIGSWVFFDQGSIDAA